MIPLVDLKRQDKLIAKDIQKAMATVVEKANFILGEEVEIFEKSFARYIGVNYATGVASGTDAILLALRALQIGKDDEVIVPANTFISTVLPVLYVGAKPVFIDIDSQTYNIDVTKIEKYITKKTKAILPVHLYGQLCDISSILSLAKRYNLFVIEDACQAHGALFNGKKAGSFGTIGCFSFYPGKNLGAYGDGGAITTNDETLDEKVRILRNIGQKKKYYHIEKGYNSRLDTIQAAVLQIKLQELDQWNKQRRIIAALYRDLLKNTAIATPIEYYNYTSNYHLYVIRAPKRDKLFEYLKIKQIFCGIHYPVPIHLQIAMKDLLYKEGDFPITEKYAKEIISLPIFPGMKKAEVIYIVKTIKEFYGY